jgi:hypothetical protein
MANRSITSGRPPISCRFARRAFAAIRGIRPKGSEPAMVHRPVEQHLRRPQTTPLPDVPSRVVPRTSSCDTGAPVSATGPSGPPELSEPRLASSPRGRSAILIVFDLLHLDGRAVRELPYARRRELLAELRLDGPAWPAPPHRISSARAKRCLRQPPRRASRGGRQAARRALPPRSPQSLLDQAHAG